MIRAGARGYITKTISGGELLQAVYRVAAGDAVFSPRLAGFVLDAFAQGTVGTGTGTGTGFGSGAGFDPELDQLSPGARGPAPHRPWLHVQGDGTGPRRSRPARQSHVSSVLRKLQLDPSQLSPLGHQPPPQS